MKIPNLFKKAGVKKVLAEFPPSGYDKTGIGWDGKVDKNWKKPVKQASTEPEVPLTQGAETPSASEISKLDISWLPFAAQTYKISPNLDDYVIVNMPLMPTDICNRNGVAFPLQELIKYGPPPMNRQVYKAWAGCPLHVEHDNEDHTKAVGVIFDTSLRRISGYGNGQHWMVYGLIGVDRKKDPQMADKVARGEINTGSMGCMAEFFTCSVCGAEAGEEPMMNCSHISSTKSVNWNIVDHGGTKKVAHLNAHDLSPFEFSLVADPAWCSALSDIILQK